MRFKAAAWCPVASSAYLAHATIIYRVYGYAPMLNATILLYKALIFLPFLLLGSLGESYRSAIYSITNGNEKYQSNAKGKSGAQGANKAKKLPRN